MTGVVRSRETRIKLRVRGPSGLSVQIDAVVDTGFNGWWTLPRATIAELQLEWKREVRGLLADASETTFNVYKAFAMWNRRKVRVAVEESEATPLIGMSLLSGCELKIDVRPGGKVSIKPLVIR